MLNKNIVITGITGAPTRTRTANLLITNQLVQINLLLLSLILKDTRVIGQEDYLADYTLTTNQRNKFSF